MKKKWILALVILLAAAAVAAGLFYKQKAEKKAEKAASEEQEELSEEIRQIYTESYQDDVEKRLEYAKSTGDYTADAMLIEPNPYGTNTLSLYVYFRTGEPSEVSYTVSVNDDDIPDFEAVPCGEDTYGTEHEFQVIGLIPDKKNTVTFTVTEENGEEKTYEYTYNMGSLAGKEEVELEQTTDQDNTEQLSNGLYVILGNDSDEQDFMYYYDNYGILRGEIPLIGYRSHRLLFKDGLMYYSISETKIAAVNQLGKVEQIFDTGQYELHHDYVFDDDGNLLVLATDTTSDTVEDRIIRINTSTGEVDCVLDLGDLFGEYKKNCVKNSDGDLDWMHINTIQWMGDQTVLLSSRETSTIMKIKDLYTSPAVAYMIGEESFWKDTGYEKLLLQKDESEGEFSGTGGQHSITYEQDPSLPEGEYYIYMFDNNLGISETNPDYDWSQIPGIETSVKEGKTSYYYKYKVDENKGTYTLVQSFKVPFSAYVSSVQENGGNILIDSGMQGIFGEYDTDGSLLAQFKMKLAKYYIYRVYKYDFAGYYFAQ